MLYKPVLKLNELLVIKEGKTVYNETFHYGVNIIRGSNSSGKSTIADFIFFALGGDINKWKPEAELCDYVLAELIINEATITIKREVSTSSRQAMWIFWGTLKESRKDSIEGWEIYPFQRSSKKESFSQVLFRMLDLPEVRGDSDNNVTMHQLLRLLYIDQMSPVDSLMRVERFDTQLTRTTIGDLMLGIYEDSLYSNELELREAQKELEYVKKQYDSVIDVLAEAEQEIELTSVKHKISETEKQLNKIKEALENYDHFKEKENQIDSETHQKIIQLQKEYQASKLDFAKNNSEMEKLMLSIEDSKQFIANLENRLKATGESLLIRQTLGQLSLTHCPNCLNPLPEPKSKNVCFLCSQELSMSIEKSQIARMKQELSHQIKESNNLLKQKEEEFKRLNRILPQLLHAFNISSGKIFGSNKKC